MILRKLVRFAEILCYKVINFLNPKFFMKYIFYCTFFTKKEFAAYEIIAHVKQKYTSQWYFNNLLFPYITIFSPLVLYFFSIDSENYKYSKTFIDLAITGSITLMGLNVLRSANTNIKDESNEGLLSGQGLIIRNQVMGRINALKAKLIRWSWVLTFFGWLFYIVQVSQIVTKTSCYIALYLMLFFVVSLFSIFVGRFMYLMDSNYLENSAAVNLFTEIFQEDKNEEEALREQLKNQGYKL